MPKINVVIRERDPDSSTILGQAFKNTPPTWENVFESAKLDIESAATQAERLGYFPPPKEVFNAFHLTPLYDKYGQPINVVIFGQDPYHQPGLAHGLAFSCKATIPASLANIYKELSTDVGLATPRTGDLTGWAKQRVLLLNTSLTVTPGMAGSQSKIWMGLISKVITAIQTANPKCIFVLWGKKALDLKPIISSKCHILESSHPSPLSAFRGFLGCKHFSKINNILREQGKEIIHWDPTYVKSEYPTYYAPVSQSIDVPVPESPSYYSKTQVTNMKTFKGSPTLQEFVIPSFARQ